MNTINENDFQNLSKDLKYLRKAAGWTQEELANIVGVTRQTINSIETNKKAPSKTLFLAIVSVFMFASAMNPVLSAVIATLKTDKIIKSLIKKST